MMKIAIEPDAVRFRNATPEQLADVEVNFQTVMMAALSFCAQPETFPVFREFAVRVAVDHGEDDLTAWMKEISPGALALLGEQLVQADLSHGGGTDGR